MSSESQRGGTPPIRGGAVLSPGRRPSARPPPHQRRRRNQRTFSARFTAGGEPKRRPCPAFLQPSRHSLRIWIGQHRIAPENLIIIARVRVAPEDLLALIVV